MFSTKIKYKDYNGVEREEVFRFHITETEIAEMQLTYDGGLKGMLQSIVDASDNRQIVEAFKKLILDSYGIKSPDGRSFMKNDKLREEFRCSAAYNKLYIRLASDDLYAAKFINGIMPESSNAHINYDKKTNMITLTDKNTGKIISVEKAYTANADALPLDEEVVDNTTLENNENIVSEPNNAEDVGNVNSELDNSVTEDLSVIE